MVMLLAVPLFSDAAIVPFQTLLLLTVTVSPEPLDFQT
jgi:hypothetical protein